MGVDRACLAFANMCIFRIKINKSGPVGIWVYLVINDEVTEYVLVVIPTKTQDDPNWDAQYELGASWFG